MRHVRTSLLGAAALLAFTACPTPPEECLTGNESVCDGGTLPPDECNSPEEAETPGCTLGQGPDAGKQGFISRVADGGVDIDWYSFVTPADTGPRSLLVLYSQVVGGSTALNLRLLALERIDGGFLGVASGTDTPGTAAPQPIQLITPYAKPGQRIFLQLSDSPRSGQPKVDNRNPYIVWADVQANPDQNEPNDNADGGATTLALSAMGAEQTGTATGYLATRGDVDVYRFSVTQSGRRVVHVDVRTVPTPDTMVRPPPYRLSWKLTRVGLGVVAERTQEPGQRGGAVSLATARLSESAGDYLLEVRGINPVELMQPAEGDLRQAYTVTVRTLEDLDTNEPNDRLAQARPIDLGPGVTTLTGRMSYVGDSEYFLLNLPAGGNRTLRYRLSVAGGGRFPPLNAVAARRLQVSRPTTQGATLADRVLACKNSAAACPKGYEDSDSAAASAVFSLCDTAMPPGGFPPCLLSDRSENDDWPNQRNMEGVLPVPPAGAAYTLFVNAPGQRDRLYADDNPWTITLTVADDADEDRPQPVPVSLSGSPTVTSGVISYGHGRLIDLDPTEDNRGIRGPDDYDAWPSDVDTYTLNLPGGASDYSWGLEWEVDSPPGELAFEVCDPGSPPAADGGFCGGRSRTFIAQPGEDLTPWYIARPTFQTGRKLWSRRTSGTTVISAVEPVACWCFNNAAATAGFARMRVLAANRTSNAPLVYRLRQTAGTYPTAYAVDGGSGSCPSRGATADGGVGTGCGLVFR